MPQTHIKLFRPSIMSCSVLPVSWRAAPEVDQASETCDTELVEQLQQCQKELYDLKLMLYTIAEGDLLLVIFSKITNLTSGE